MNYTIDIHNDEVVLITFSGSSDFVESMEAREKVVQVCLDNNISKVLADWREGSFDHTVKMVDMFEFGSTWGEARKGIPLRVATVMPDDAHSEKSIRFIDTVAHNRGLCCSVFDDIDKAIVWLNESAN